MVFHWNFSDSESPQVSKNLHSILADLKNAVVLSVFTCPVISKSFSPCIYPLVTVPRAPITIDIIVTFMFHRFFNSLAMSRYLSFLSHSFNFTLWSAGLAKGTILQVLSFSFIRSGRLAEIGWFVYISKSQRSFCVSLTGRDSRLCIYQLIVWSNFNFLHNYQWITLPTQSCLVLYSFCVYLLHSLIMRLMVSSLSPYNLHLLFCCDLSILALISSVLMALFCAVIRRDSVSLFRCLFLSHIHVFSFAMLLVSRSKRS